MSGEAGSPSGVGAASQILRQVREIAPKLSARLRRVKPVSATRTAIVCTACGYQAFQWRGRCPQCGAWDSFTEDVPRLPGAGPRGAPGGAAPAAPVTLADIEAAAHDR